MLDDDNLNTLTVIIYENYVGALAAFVSLSPCVGIRTLISTTKLRPKRFQYLSASSQNAACWFAVSPFPVCGFADYCYPRLPKTAMVGVDRNSARMLTEVLANPISFNIRHRLMKLSMSTLFSRSSVSVSHQRHKDVRSFASDVVRFLRTMGAQYAFLVPLLEVSHDDLLCGPVIPAIG